MTSERTGADRVVLEATTFDLGPCRVLALSGECDLATRHVLLGALDAGLAGNLVLLVDLSRVAFCDADCAARILDSARSHPLALLGLTGTVRRVFDLLDPSQEVPRYPTPEAAIWSLAELS